MAGASAEFRAMAEADRVFSDLLVKAYGKQAGDKRYQPMHPEHPEIDEAGAAFVAASDAWRAALRAGGKL